MVLPTAEEVTNLYLYGSKTRPNDLTNPSLLEKRRPTTIEVSRNEYMTQGAGRFFTAKDFAFIEEFFNSSPLYITPGTYSKTEILRKLGYIDGNGAGIKKAFISDHTGHYGIYDPDYMERTFIWGSTAFKVSDGAVFIVKEDGSKEIRNFSIEPYVKDENPENFDFIGNTASADTAKEVSSIIDPSGIGTRVNFKFIGDVATSTITQEDFSKLTFAQRFGYLVAGEIGEKEGNKMLNDLFYNGEKPIGFLDKDDKPIIYGTKSNNNLKGFISDTKVDISEKYYRIYKGYIPTPFTLKNILSDYVKNGITYVTGDGNDTIEGTKYNDTFIGGKGDDVYIVQNEKDEIIEKEGIDEVKSSVSYTLGNYLENLTLTGDQNINATGNELDNTLRGEVLKFLSVLWFSFNCLAISRTNNLSL